MKVANIQMYAGMRPTSVDQCGVCFSCSLSDFEAVLLKNKNTQCAHTSAMSTYFGLDHDLRHKISVIYALFWYLIYFRSCPQG